MGMVIEKTVQILKLVASHKYCTLKSLCEATGYKKSAICQMLRSMVDNGLLLRDHKGEYHIGSLINDLAEKREGVLRRQKLIESIAVDLNTATNANVTAATIRNGKYRRLFSCSSFKITRLTATAPDEEVFYGNATGRVLLANARTELRFKLIERLGVPSPEEWQDASRGVPALLAELEKIRKQGFAELINAGQKGFFIAVPLLCDDTPLPFAVGIGVPPVRAKEKDDFLQLLHQAAQRFK